MDKQIAQLNFSKLSHFFTSLHVAFLQKEFGKLETNFG